MKILERGGVGVMPTDTIYGIVGSALRPKTVERIYRLRRRNRKKPMIILINLIADLKLFSVNVDSKTKKILKRFWPGKVSVILPCPSKKFAYLHRGAKTLAFRLPASPAKRPAGFAERGEGESAERSLSALLRKTGPLVAPSANPEGKPPSKTIREAKKYFGKKVDFYIDDGRLARRPSKLVTVAGDESVVLRS
jgi:L-threonylcarbamoyladenylate synthase